MVGKLLFKSLDQPQANLHTFPKTPLSATVIRSIYHPAYSIGKYFVTFEWWEMCKYLLFDRVVMKGEHQLTM